MNHNQIGFLSTYPPKACGIATFTQDLAKSLDKYFQNPPVVIAINNKNIKYNDRVIMKIQQQDRSAYKETAHILNHSSLKLIILEHEYGIFGGDCGEYILDFVDNLKLPLITTLHTVLPSPLPKQLYILKKLGEKSSMIITMANITKKMLEDIYDIPADKIAVIPHGVTLQTQCLSSDELKTAFGFKNRYIISTFGLLSPGKGLEYGIEAIAKIAPKYPNVLYLILGQTHPCIKETSGETYRKKLEDLVYKLNLKKNVKFINRYLLKGEIAQYLSISDIYLTPYLDQNQAVSGTLAYATGYGKVIISTPYLYAQEILADEKGLLVNFADADNIAEMIEIILMNPAKRKSLESKMLAFGKTMMWENVADIYAALIQKIISKVCKESLVDNGKMER
ncbi:glycosyltransferase family 4 protein [Pectinatus haikarae]|uniref:glycosyltransferase family 4 protein n=1 Tax=Pectinatus haikarae TaxID=349096 RepID=UPI0018C5FBC8|nr:glycosyltransferase family 4 protein [Pectinatus haikarae]